MKISGAVTLTREQWLETAENVQGIFELLLNALKQNGASETDVEEFTADATCALTAMRYVAEFASDKCVFAAINKEVTADERTAE